ncbi:MAG TPA: DUF4239 domain-containing protein [Candidatus Omnitrophota bacterium]|nr:DUF4239 domain-containing protein [Candidatus Omnitrophota bacterium]
MPFGQKILWSIPVIPLGIIIIITAVGLSIIGLSLVRRYAPSRILKTHNELTGAIFNALTTAYAVLLAFVVVVSWQNFDKAKYYAETEANSLVDLHRNSAAFSQPFQNTAHLLLKGYADTVVNEEWEMLARGEESMQARELLRKLWSLYTSYDPKNEKEKIFFAASVQKLENLREMRRLRIVESGPGVHPVLWFVLIIGGMTTVSFTFFFGADSFGAHIIMASTLAVIISLILFTILLFDYPFTGSSHIGAQVFKQVINF